MEGREGVKLLDVRKTVKQFVGAGIYNYVLLLLILYSLCLQEALLLIVVFYLLEKVKPSFLF